jgi:hypothetical protein
MRYRRTRRCMTPWHVCGPHPGMAMGSGSSEGGRSTGEGGGVAYDVLWRLGALPPLPLPRTFRSRPPLTHPLILRGGVLPHSVLPGWPRSLDRQPHPLGPPAGVLRPEIRRLLQLPGSFRGCRYLGILWCPWPHLQFQALGFMLFTSAKKNPGRFGFRTFKKRYSGYHIFC